MKKQLVIKLEKDKDGKLAVHIEGSRDDLLTALVLVASDEKGFLDLLMDATFATIALHMKQEHGVDVIELLEKKMEQELGYDIRKKERVVN